MCDATLDIIAQIDDRWAERVQREKFQVKFTVYSLTTYTGNGEKLAWLFLA